MEIAREGLIEDLRRYKRKKGLRMTVVFDGTFANVSKPIHTSYKGIRVIYSRGMERADDVIVRMVRASPHGALVVSSDREVGQRCHELGATVISARDFEDRMLQELMTETAGGVEEEVVEPRASTEKKGPSRRLSKRQRKDRRRLSRL